MVNQRNAAAASFGIVMALASCDGGFLPLIVDPNGNPIAEVSAVCQSDSQDNSYFGPAFTNKNETGRESLSRMFQALSQNSEPSLACGAEPDEGYRLTIVGDWPNVPLMIRAQRIGDIATIQAVFPRHDPVAQALVPARMEGRLTANEFREVAELAAAVNLPRSRAIPLSADEGYSRHRLLEFRQQGRYGLVHRSLRKDETLDVLTMKLILAAGIDYPWF